MIIEVNTKKEVDIKTLKIHMKVCDSFSFEIRDSNGGLVKERDGDYVPAFMPGEHYGDYLILDIDIETGLITNWRKNVPSLYEDIINA